MKLGAQIIRTVRVLVLSVLAPLAAHAQDNTSYPALAGNPYAAIVARNVFNLVPMPTNNPDADVKPPEPPSKITPNGIMDLFGTPQVLFKVATPPKAGQPPADKSYTMSEGDREDGIAVIKIDQEARVITFDNNGIVQKLPLIASTDTGGSAGAGPGGRGPGGPGGPGDRFHGRFPGRGLSGSGYGGPGGGFVPPPPPNYSPSNDGSSPNMASSSSGPNPDTSVEGAQAKLQNILNDPNHLTPEAQVIMMEANRQQLQAQGDPTAGIIPQTDLTPSDPNAP